MMVLRIGAPAGKSKTPETDAARLPDDVLLDKVSHFLYVADSGGVMGDLLLAIDVGNTDTVVGLYDGTDLKTHWRLTTHAERTADEVGMWLHQLLRWAGVAPDDLVDVAVASVVPPMDPRLREGIARYLGRNAFFVEPGVHTDMPLLVDAPQELGADRLCDAVAAFAEHGGPCVVLDFGTAVTWEVVSADGKYLGGTIAPGPTVTAGALSSKTAKLPEVAMAPPPRVIGKGTVDSIQSGLFYGYLGLIEGVTRRILDQVGEATVVATGGLAGVFANHTGLIQHVEPDLTLQGLRLLWQLNRREQV
jgi:type III pantothenate kinase